jgi:hypothetical protein
MVFFFLATLGVAPIGLLYPLSAFGARPLLERTLLLRLGFESKVTLLSRNNGAAL